MNDPETIKGRVRKLLELSRSDNENEAAAAIEKANYLMEEYGIDGEGLKFESVSVRATKYYVNWRLRLAYAVAWLYGCFYYHDRTEGAVVFTGEPLDVFMASEMYQYLVKTTERISRRALRKNAKYFYRQDFRAGIAAGLHDRIHALGGACAWKDRRNSKIMEAADYVRSAVPLEEENPPRRQVKTGAFAAGFEAAGEVSLARQAGHDGKPPELPAPALRQGELF
ncbi:MAG: DUF2786 domain-containing protein [Spirochaetaceae bacterium]|jgi:hypothetical protein|nr:DUF2786 domain-containing protein [Spirochaetaceae bacterium]